MNIMTDMTQAARSPGDPRVIETGPSSLTATHRAARALGWLSIGLGLAELLAARKFAGKLGMEGKEGLIRTYGAREIGSGIASLSVSKETGVGSRVLGDMIDLATLVPALATSKGKRGNVMLAIAIVAGVAVADTVVYAALKKNRSRYRSEDRDYSGRSGFPQGVELARGAGRDQSQPRSQPQEQDEPAAERSVPVMPTAGEPPLPTGAV